MSAGPAVSVVIPVYNCGRYVREAVGSVLAQTYGDLEVIVVDDGSSDGTPDVVRGMAGPIRLVRLPHGGCAAARNTGLRAARGRYIAFQDGDDVWLPEKLALQVPRLEADPGVGAVYADMADLLPDGTRGAPRLRDHPRDRLSGDILEYLLQWWVIGLPTVVARREVFETTGPFDETFREACSDWEMWLRLARHFRIAYVDRVLALYRQHESNLTRRSGSLNVVATQRRVLDKTFADPRTPPSARRVRRRAYAHIYAKAARDLAAEGQRAPAARLFLRALAWDPGFSRPWLGLARLGAGERWAGWLQSARRILRGSAAPAAR